MHTYLRFTEQTEQLTTLNEIHYHVEILRILECAPQRNAEWLLDSAQHPPFIIGMLHLLHFHNLLFLQDLDGIVTLIVFRLDQVHSPKASCTKCSLEIEVRQRIFALGLTSDILSGIRGLGMAIALRGIDEVVDGGLGGGLTWRGHGPVRLGGSLRSGLSGS